MRLTRPWARPFILWLSRRCLSWCYREWRVVGGERIPATGPVLLIGNHPNDLPDILLGFFTTNRHVRYVATVTQGMTPPARATYRGLGVIPVARIRDVRKLKASGIDMAALNQAAMASVSEVFQAGEVVGMFPEGGVYDKPHLGSFRSGVAQVALDYIDNGFEFGENRDITVVPFGVQYEAPNRLGSDCWAVIGEPFSVREWLERHGDADRRAQEFANRLRESLLTVTRNAPDWETARQRDELLAALAAATDPAHPIDAAIPLLHEVGHVMARDSEGAASGPAAGTGLDANEPASPRRLVGASHTLAQAVERAGGIGTSAVDHARLLYALGYTTAAKPTPLLRLLLGSIPALLGALLNAPAWSLAHWWGRKYQTARTDIPARFMVPGLFWVVGWWITLALVTSVVLTVALANAAKGIAWAILLLLLLPRLGDHALAWWRAWRGYRLVRIIRSWSPAEHKALGNALRHLRPDPLLPDIMKLPCS